MCESLLKACKSSLWILLSVFKEWLDKYLEIRSFGDYRVNTANEAELIAEKAHSLGAQIKEMHLVYILSFPWVSI